MLHINDRCLYSCLWITPDLRCQKRLWILRVSTTLIKIWRSVAFFAFSPLHLNEPLRKQKVVVCDLWLVDFDPFCVFLCFKVSCFVFEKHHKFYLSSKIFFNFFTLKHGKFRFQRWNCSYRASKSRGNTATEGWKRTGTFPLTFTFADKRCGCYGNGLIEKIWIWRMLKMNTPIQEKTGSCMEARSKGPSAFAAQWRQKQICCRKSFKMKQVKYWSCQINGKPGKILGKM